MRRAIMSITFAVIEQLLRGQWSGECLNTNAPADLRVVGVEHGPAMFGHCKFYVVLESDSFAEVKPGDHLPELDPFKYEVRR